LIDAIAELDDFSDLSVPEQKEISSWLRSVTDSSYEVTIRTFEEICKMRQFGSENDEDWERMALEIFNINYEKHRIIEMREAMDMSIEEQVNEWCDEFDKSESAYYDCWDRIRAERE